MRKKTEKQAPTLASLRKRIDAIDVSLVKLLSERAEKASVIGSRKKDLGLKIRDRDRETKVLARIARMNKGPLKDRALKSICRRIMTVCSEVQKKK